MEENNRGLLVTRSAIILHYRGHMARVKKIKSPTQLELVEPLFAVLVELGGSATIDEIRDNIIKKLKLSDIVEICEMQGLNHSQVGVPAGIVIDGFAKRVLAVRK